MTRWTMYNPDTNLVSFKIKMCNVFSFLFINFHHQPLTFSVFCPPGNITMYCILFIRPSACTHCFSTSSLLFTRIKHRLMKHVYNHRPRFDFCNGCKLKTNWSRRGVKSLGTSVRDALLFLVFDWLLHVISSQTGQSLSIFEICGKFTTERS